MTTNNTPPPDDHPASASGAVHISEDEWAKLQQDCNDYKTKYLHLLADNENARKRLQKERQDMNQYAMEKIILSFLQPIDHFENAIKFAEATSEEVKNWAVGFEMILSQFNDVLTENGVHSIASVGKPFDPHLHEAVEMVETDEAPAGTVIEEFLKGYQMGKRTIRPARVKVAQAPSSKEEAETDQLTNEEESASHD